MIDPAVRREIEAYLCLEHFTTEKERYSEMLSLGSDVRYRHISKYVNLNILWKFGS